VVPARTIVQMRGYGSVLIGVAINMNLMKLESSFVRRRRPLVIGFMLALGAATVWMLAEGDRGGVIAGVLTSAVATLTLAAPMLAAPWHAMRLDAATLADEALDLPREVARREQAEQNLFLADTGKAFPQISPMHHQGG